MKVFVFEHCCCRPARADATAEALRTEGRAMLWAVVADLGRLEDVEPRTFVADDLPDVYFSHRRVRPADEEAEFRKEAAAADYSLVIAPEIDGVLESRCRRVLEAGGTLLGPGPDAVRLTADKLALAHHFATHGVPTPPTVPLSEVLGRRVPHLYPAVCKPRCGAGSLYASVVRSAAELKRAVASCPGDDFIVQPYLPGTPASVALLIGPQRHVALEPAGQNLATDRSLSYLGGRAPLPQPLADRARQLAERAVKCVPGLHGYVGVDLVLGPRPAGDVVIEINPRLTTSYIGLRALARTNLMAALLRVVRGESPRLSWSRTRRVEWNTSQVAVFPR
jgi:hypothetical protein